MSFLENLPIRNKLMVMIMAVTLSILLLASLAFISYDIRLAKQSLEQEFSTLARVLGNRSSAALVFDDATLAQDNLLSLEKTPNLVMACVYRIDGGIFAEYSTREQDQDQGFCPSMDRTLGMQTEFDDEFLHVSSLIELEEDNIGFIYLRAELRSIDERIRKQSIATLLIAACATLAAYLLSNLVQRLISIPLTNVANTATTIEQKRDYSLRAPEYGRDELGKLSHSFNTMLDTIEYQNQQLLEAKENLESMVDHRTREMKLAIRELESFAYSVSHDLRAPLRSINGFSQAVMETSKGQLDEESQEYLQRVCNASERMSELIDALLSLSRTSQQAMSRSSTNLSAIAHECMRELAEAHPERKVEYRIEENLLAYADPHLMRIVLQNLLSNAWKFTAKRKDAKIEFDAQQKNSVIVYYVRDNGAGFDMEYQDRLFVAFQRLHDPSDFKGTGIGLATVARIIHRHGGEIWAQSEPGEGATFNFTLEAEVNSSLQSRKSP